MTPKIGVGQNFVLGNDEDGYKLRTVTAVYKGTDGSFWYRFQVGTDLVPERQIEKLEPIRFVKG